ncbi:unnamed protein product [Lactuca saligna]|uniref:TIR domain-containing protein n=1 Tax=Lactuca saligna TaxID=75948 RepID=A0AA36EKT4_LACSI|nr:unnamed protein product [Lactuca saligna]
MCVLDKGPQYRVRYDPLNNMVGAAENLRFYWKLTSVCIKFISLSFRGEDTRKTFVDHLYTALEQQGIYTYKDDETLPRDSSWCLDELAHIMKCKDTGNQIVFPIFYNVDPSDVRKQKRKYGETFCKYELENKSNVESWRKALVDASNISGWEPKHIANGHESKVIKEIVDTISQRLQLVTSSANENLIGIAARMQGLESELQIGSGGVRMIGIWGVGGGGKTTLVSAMYDEFSSKFDGCCFVKNIREESRKNGLEKLQEKILSGVLKQKKVKGIGRVEEGRHMMLNKLCRKKVLIVLDDVDHLDQLKALAGSHDWYGEGSRIIITTRDEHVLNANRIDVKHNIILLNNDEAIKLFRKNACQDYRWTKDYEQLSKEVVSYAGGLPLALTVIGSFLCDKNIHEWRSALARLKEIPDDNILETLKVSFDGLKPLEQDLFLDIACFFRWDKKNTTMEILDACGFHPVIGIKVLIQKALITISKDGAFDMHDLVQEMGHHIVRGVHPKNPEKHSRVWKVEDVLKICSMDAMMEIDKIEAIKMDFWIQPAKEQEQNLHLVAANMKNLRYMESIGDPAKSLFNDLPLRELCCLLLSFGKQKQLWEGFKLLPSLKLLKLHFMDKLIITPDFNGLPNLERFILYGCMCLVEIHPSIGSLEKLVYLSIEVCPSLEMFPPITGIKKLETLEFPGQPKLVKFPKIQQQKMENLPHLDLDNSRSEVASYIESYSNYFVICWRCGCSNLPGVKCCVEDPCLRRNICLRFFHNLQELRFLRKLDLSMCHLGDEDIGSDVLEFPNLQELNLEGNYFSQLNFSHLRVPRLKWLNVTSCEKLVELSEMPSSIAVVIADDCSSLESFGDISNCKWLWKVSLLGDNKLGDGDILLDSMLQGNAIEDHFISVRLQYQNPRAFVGRFFRGKTFTKRLPHVKWGRYMPLMLYVADTFRLRLPDDWCNEFCGFLIRIITPNRDMWIDIIIKQDPDQEDSRFEIWQESNETPEPEYDGEVKTYVGYVSFSSLRRTTSLNSSYNIISFSIQRHWTSFSAEFVPRKSKDDPVQTTKVATDCSEFWHEENDEYKAFMTQDNSKSSVSILFRDKTSETSIHP